MRVAVIGRTQPLLDAAELLLQEGFEIPIVWTCAAERYYGVEAEAFQSFAGRIGAEFCADVAINKPANVRRLSDSGCDLGISVNWKTVLSPEVLACFPIGVLNAHAGELPRF